MYSIVTLEDRVINFMSYDSERAWRRGNMKEVQLCSTLFFNKERYHVDGVC